MRKNWEMEKLGNVCKIIKKIKAPMRTTPYIEIGDIDVNSKKIRFKEKASVKGSNLSPGNCVIVSRVRPTRGAVALLKEKGFAISSAFSILKPKENLNLNFLFYYLGSNPVFFDYLKNCQKGLNYPSCKEEDILNFKILLPSLAEQKRIVKVLDNIFNVIDKAKESTEKNISNSKDLFESYLNNIFNNPRKNWEESKLNKIGIIQTGTTPKTSEKENYGNFISFIKPADVNFSGTGDLRYNNEGLSEIGLKKGRLIDKNSVLMVCIGATIGKAGFSERKVSCNQQINTITFYKGYEPKFFYYLMISEKFQNKVLLEGQGSQATLPIINKSKWGNLSINFPKSKEDQREIYKNLDELREKTQKLEKNYQRKLENLKELKKSTLQRAFNGEL